MKIFKKIFCLLQCGRGSAQEERRSTLSTPDAGTLERPDRETLIKECDRLMLRYGIYEGIQRSAGNSTENDEHRVVNEVARELDARYGLTAAEVLELLDEMVAAKIRGR